MTITSYFELNQVIGRIAITDGYYMIVTDHKISIWLDSVRIEVKFNYSEIRLVLDNGCLCVSWKIGRSIN